MFFYVGIKRTSTTNNLNREILLQVFDMPSDVNLPMLSDADLTEVLNCLEDTYSCEPSNIGA